MNEKNVTKRSVTLLQQQSAAMTASLDGMAILDQNGTYTYMNDAHAKIYGYDDPGELLGKTWDTLYDPEQLGWFERYIMPALRENGQWRGEATGSKRDGSKFSQEVSLSTIEGGGFVCVVRDITERKALERQLRRQALHDPLTNLPNRTLFMDRLKHALARATRQEGKVTVLFMDLDNFKFVNDSLGHEVGDLLLVAVTGRIKACLRPEDTIARLGGDEFTVLLEGVASPGYAIDVAERVAEGLRAPFAVASRELHTSASIGIASSSSASDTPGDLLREADLALYAAKSEGKARHAVFDPGMSTQARERLEMESDLRRAMQRGELKVYYQPKVSLKTGKIVSMEALMRWEHPARGLLEPGKFLPLAEETGLILPIGGWVLEEVCRQGKEWRERYPDHGALRVCANVSARQFLQPDFADTLAETLRATGLVPSALSLEIAENTLVGDEETVVAKLRALKDAGVHVVIDDFGAGYSSLSRMGSLPTDILKVDRSLTVNLGRRPEDTAIVAAMIDLGHALGWVVNAHGVETADQLALLRGLGCDMAQGFYFSGPVAGEEASALLAAGSRWG